MSNFSGEMIRGQIKRKNINPPMHECLAPVDVGKWATTQEYNILQITLISLFQKKKLIFLNNILLIGMIYTGN